MTQEEARFAAIEFSGAHEVVHPGVEIGVVFTEVVEMPASALRTAVATKIEEMHVEPELVRFGGELVVAATVFAHAVHH